MPTQSSAKAVHDVLGALTPKPQLWLQNGADRVALIILSIRWSVPYPQKSLLLLQNGAHLAALIIGQLDTRHSS